MPFSLPSIPQDWIAALSSSGVVLVLWSAVRLFTKTGGEKAIQHLFDTRLEGLKAELRAREKDLEQEVQSASHQLADLKAGALENARSRSALLATKRLEAAEHLWSAIIDNRRMSFAATMASGINMQVLMKRASERSSNAQGVRDFAGSIVQDVDIGRLPPLDKHRLFTSPVAWALHKTYMQTLVYCVAQLKLAQLGSDLDTISGPEVLLAQLSAAVPSRKEEIAARGMSALPLVLGDLEELILKELQASIEGEELDSAQVSRASLILALATKTQDELNTKAPKPDGAPAEAL